ncbi:hypothetical protein [Nocardia cyriacigeorgica]|uniref:hypothetical protein n=1 Tax=Nocardia cyriacigeorgica TaxID=135487 RepID=UPI003CC7F2EC
MGREDGFFGLGGDSVIAIQWATRAGEAGLPLTPAGINTPPPPPPPPGVFNRWGGPPGPPPPPHAGWCGLRGLTRSSDRHGRTGDGGACHHRRSLRRRHSFGIRRPRLFPARRQHRSADRPFAHGW